MGPWRELQKKGKYQNLAADLAKQYRSMRVRVVPVVFGVLGTVANLRKHLKDSQILTDGTIDKIVEEGLYAVL